MILRQIAQSRTSEDNVVIQLMVLMFFSSVGRGFTAPYVNLYLNDLGATGAMIGTIVGIAALVELIVSPVLNNFADSYRRHRLLLAIQYALFGVGSFLLAISQNLVIVTIFVIFIELGKRSAIILSIQLCLVRLEQIDRAIVGRIRGFNAIGFAVSNLFQGMIFPIAGYLGMFFGGGLFSLVSVWYTRVLPREATTHKRDNTLAPRKRKFYYLIVIQFFVQLGLVSGFAFWLIHFTENVGIYIEDVGILLAFSAFLEFPFFVLFDSVVRRYDVRLIYIGGAFGMGLISLATGAITSPIWAIPLLIARGFAFALLNMSTHILISRISDPRNVATNQSLLQVTVPGLATLFGAPLMGLIYDAYSPVIFYAVCMVMLMAGSILMLILYRLMVPTTIE